MSDSFLEPKSHQIQLPSKKDFQEPFEYCEEAALQLNLEQRLETYVRVLNKGYNCAKDVEYMIFFLTVEQWATSNRFQNFWKLYYLHLMKFRLDSCSRSGCVWDSPSYAQECVLEYARR